MLTVACCLLGAVLLAAVAVAVCAMARVASWSDDAVEDYWRADAEDAQATGDDREVA